jgi:hypothetical protein
MPGSWKAHEHPRLTDHNHQLTSPCTNKYNCIAWAAGNDRRWWWPDARGVGYWPRGIARGLTLPAFEAAFATLGYETCVDGSVEDGFEKVAIYARMNGLAVEITHAARQLSDGRWSSKMGTLEDISHNAPEDVGGAVYGAPVRFMRRQRR